MNFKKLLILLPILIPLILCSCNSGQGKASGSASEVLERLTKVQQNSSARNSFLINTTSEEDLLKGKNNSIQLAVGDYNFKQCFFSSHSDVKVDEKGRNTAWVNDSFMYFKFRLKGDYILPKGFFIYYNDVFNSKDYQNPAENPVLNNIYMSFNRINVTNINVLDGALYCAIPKAALEDEELEVIVLFPDGNGAFLEKGKNILSIFGIGLIDLEIDTISLDEGVGFPLMSTKAGNLDEKATIGWYAPEEDGTWTKENMKFYFKTNTREDMKLATSYQPLSNDQECKVYFNDKYVGSLSKTKDVILPASDIVTGIQKVEYKIEPAILESDLVEGGSDKDYIGIKIRSITIK